MSAFLENLRAMDLPFGIMDTVYGLYILYGLIRGLFRGLALELAGLTGSLLIFFGAWRFYIPLSEWLLTHTRLQSQATGQFMAYILAVIICLFVWQLLMLLLKKIFHVAVPAALQKPGGAVLGGLKCAVTLCVLLLAVTLTPFEGVKQALVEESVFGRATQQWVPAKVEQWFPGVLPDALTPPDEEGSDGSGNP